MLDQQLMEHTERERLDWEDVKGSKAGEHIAKAKSHAQKITAKFDGIHVGDKRDLEITKLEDELRVK